MLSKVLFNGLIVLLIGCNSTVESLCQDSTPQDPNGFCEVDSDCAETDYCLVDWCHGTKDDCKPVNRCHLKAEEGDWCEGDNWCQEGLVCPIPSGMVASTCKRM